MNGACNVKLFLAPTPWALGRGQKVKYHLISITKSISKGFFYQTLCVLSQMKDTKHIRRDLILSPESCPKGGTLEHWGYPGAQTIFFQTWSCSISVQRGWRAEQNASNIFILGSKWWPWSKGQISLTCQFQRFLYQTLCVFSQIKDRKHIEQNFNSVAKVMPREGTSGCWGSQKL